MNKLVYMACAVLAAMAICSCDEDTQGVGMSLTKETDKLDVTTEDFLVTTRTVIADSVYTNSKNCYLGMVRDPETQADVKSEFTTQFHLLDRSYIADDKDIVGRYDGKAAADSCNIVLYLSSPFNTTDSLASIKLKVHELTTTMEENTPYYSNYNPVKRGMVRTEGINKGKMFTYKNLLETDSIRSLTNYLPNICVTLNEPYTDKNGVVYNNYGTYLIRQYHEHHEYFRNSYAFSHNVCPGFFFEVTDGYGFHSKVSNIGLRVYYRAQTDSGVVNTGLVLAGTKEVMQTTLVTNNEQAIRKMAAETQHTYIKSPAGLFTEIELPVKQIKQAHTSDSLIAAKIVLQRINDQSADSRMLGIPQTLLMVQTDSLKSFFEKNKVPDSRTSYYTNFNFVGSSYVNDNTYNFINISALITFMWNNLQKGLSMDAQWEDKHPNWNKVLLVPVTYSSSSSTSVEHDMSLTSTRLVGGVDNPNEPIKVSVVYAKFKEQ